MIKALIFDMDDTLVQSAVLHKESFRKVLKKYGVDANKIPPSLERTFFGKKLIEVADLFIKHFSLDISPEAIMQEREEMIKEMLKDIKPMPGLKKLIKFLESSDYLIALATSSTKDYAKIILKKFKIEDLFDVVVTAEDIKKSKPDPQTFLITAKKLQVSPKECIVIEDAKNGIVAAKKAGMKTIGVVNTVFDIKQDLSMADKIVKSLEDIEETIESS